MMKKLLIVVGVLLAIGAAGGSGAEDDADRVRKGLVGTWKNVDAEFPEGILHVKHITPTHWTWVTYDAKAMTPLASAGGTWSLEGDKYKERIDFASDTHPHLPGKEYTFTLKFEGDKLSIKVSPNADFEADEVWERMKGRP